MSDLPAVNTRIWRPVEIRNSIMGYQHDIKDVRLNKSKGGSFFCRATNITTHPIVQGEWVAGDCQEKGVVVFLDRMPQPYWTHLVVKRQLTKAVLACAVVGTREELLNVYISPPRAKRTDILQAGLPKHTANFIFVGDRVMLLRDLVGTSDDKKWTQTMPASTSVTVADVEPRRLTIEWKDPESFKCFRGQVSSEAVTVVRNS